MSSATQLGTFGVAVEGATEALTKDTVEGTTFAQLPSSTTGQLFPDPLSLSGSDTVSLGSSSVDLGAQSSYQAYALIGSVQDPDDVVTTAANTVWLKLELTGTVSASASGSAGKTALGLDADASATFLDYRQHATSDPVAKSVLDAIAHPRLPTSMAALQSMAKGDALAFIAAADLSFSAVFTYTDLISGTVAVLDKALGLSGAGAFEIDNSASVDVAFGANDQFRLVFSPGSTLDFAVDLQKTGTTTLSAGAQLGFTAQFTSPDQLATLVESYLSSRLGTPYQTIKDLITKLEDATDISKLSTDEQALLESIATKLGWGDALTNFESVRSKLIALPSDLETKLESDLSQQLKVSFAFSYSRVATNETLASFEAKTASLAPLLPALLIGDVSGVTAKLTAGDPGFLLHNYLSSREISKQLSFGVSLSVGSWAMVGKRTTSTSDTKQVNQANEVRRSWSGQTAYASQWGKEGGNYAFELTAAMSAFAPQATADTFQFGMTLSWVWDDQPLTPRLRSRLLDLANVWGVLSLDQNAGAISSLSAMANQSVHAELSLTVPDGGVRRLPILPVPQLEAVWVRAMAEALQRVFLPNSDLAIDIAQRLAIYQGVAGWAFRQTGAAEMAAVQPSYDQAQPPLAASDREQLQQIDLPSGPSLDTNTTVFSLDNVWHPSQTTVNMPSRYQQMSAAFGRLGAFLNGTADSGAIADMFSGLTGLADDESLARLLGSVLAQVLGGAVGLVTGSLSIAPESGGTAVVFTGSSTPA